MSGVATHGSVITESTKPNHVAYSIEYWSPVGSHCVSWDLEGNCIGYQTDYDWVSGGTGFTNAKITGTVSSPSSKMKIGSVNVASVGDATIETWVADPPVPTSTGTTRYTPSGATSGSGSGIISSGSSKGSLGGKAIALIGSQVTTHLGTITTISTGNNKISFNS